MLAAQQFVVLRGDFFTALVQTAPLICLSFLVTEKRVSAR